MTTVIGDGLLAVPRGSWTAICSPPVRTTSHELTERARVIAEALGGHLALVRHERRERGLDLYVTGHGTGDGLWVPGHWVWNVTVVDRLPRGELFVRCVAHGGLWAWTAPLTERTG